MAHDGGRDLKAYFYELADGLAASVRPEEAFLCWYDGEASDFIRMNQAKIRQAGSVSRHELTLTLIIGQKQARHGMTLMMDMAEDAAAVRRTLRRLRETLACAPDDPYLLYADQPASSERIENNPLPDSARAVTDILDAAKGRDLVGIFAAGKIAAGFAGSTGQRNWYETNSFHLDWSLYLEKDKAVKSRYAGFQWDPEELRHKMDQAAAQSAAMDRPPRTVPPGEYRTYLSPTALNGFMDMLAWRAFGLKSHRTGETALIRMVKDGKTLHPAVSMAENTADGAAPDFTAEGFIKPNRVDLIAQGRYKDCLTSPRSGKEYGVDHTAANPWEIPESFDMAPGDLPSDQILKKLGAGLYINNVWYLNFSDVAACRITGMTRFACFRVENGEIAGPVNVMRFDESVYRMLGDNLIGLTSEREFIMSSSTYGGRSAESARLPGALIADFRLTL